MREQLERIKKKYRQAFMIHKEDEEWKEIRKLYIDVLKKSKKYIYPYILEVLQENKGHILDANEIAYDVLQRIKTKKEDELYDIWYLQKFCFHLLANIVGSSDYDMFVPPMANLIRRTFKKLGIEGITVSQWTSKNKPGYKITQEVIEKLRGLT